MKVITINDEMYPEQLRKINRPPKVLYVVGDESILKEKSIAIVGSRNCTEYGEKQAHKFAKELTEQGLQIVSGLAKGIDTSSHQGCLSANGKTIAVLGCGFNNLYPPENKLLYKEILDNGGAIISEYSPNAEASSDKFRSRNRIVSGLSLAVLIIEAAYRSGTTITARFAYEQGKPVFCIPNSLENNKGVGTNELIKKGALVATSIDDILEKCKIERKVCKTIESRPLQISLFNEKNINPEYRKIYRVLAKEPINSNEICKKTKISINEVNSRLLLMEMDGLIKRVAGNEFIKLF